MKIRYVKHAGFVLETDDGFRVGWDIGSFSAREDVQAIGRLDAFTVSHKHQDHLYADHIVALNPERLLLSRECVDTLGDALGHANPEIIVSGQTIELSPGLSIEYFASDHGPNATQPLLENLGFIIKADSKTVYFPGDMYYPSGPEVPGLEVDYALLPVGDYYTFGPQQALKFAKSFKSIGTVVPMHFEIAPENKQIFLELAQDQLPVTDPDTLK